MSRQAGVRRFLCCAIVSVCEARLDIYQTVRRSVHVGVGLTYLRRMSGVVYTTRTRCAHNVKISVHIASLTPA